MGIDRQLLFLKLIFKEWRQLLPSNGLATDASHSPTLIGLIGGVV